VDEASIKSPLRQRLATFRQCPVVPGVTRVVSRVLEAAVTPEVVSLALAQVARLLVANVSVTAMTG
jgi:hypothetical protein